MSRNHIAIIGTVGVPASYGGFETLVDQLVGAEDAIFTVYCSSVHYKTKISTYKNANLVYLPLNANGPVSVIYDIFSIIHSVYNGHRKLLILGVSGAIIIPLLRVVVPSIRAVTNIDGVEWRRDKWRGLAKYFLRLSEYLAVRFSTIVVADNDAIADYVEFTYGRKCETIGYGGNHALQPPVDNSTDIYLDIDFPYAFSLCRIEPENNVHLILKAFSEIPCYLIFIGNWQGSAYGRRLYSEYSGKTNIRLLDPVYDLDILFFYRSGCQFYVHGHSAGGTNPSLVEMMHFEKPVVAFDCLYNRATMENNGEFFDSIESLQKLALDDDWLLGAPELLEVASRRYTWDIVRKQYLSLFG